jgi:steroid delta-isomerase-like uncharacterized protein
MSSSILKPIAMRFYDAFNDRNLDQLEKALQPDWIIHPSISGEGSNFQKYKPIAAALLEAFPDVHFNVEGMIEEGDTIAVRAVITGTQQGNWLGVAASGQRIRVFAHDFHRIENNQIAESWHVEDWLSGIQQMSGTSNPG